MLLDMYTCKEVAHCAYVGKVLNRLETEGGQVEQRVSLWMMVADKNEIISCSQAIYLFPPPSTNHSNTAHVPNNSGLAGHYHNYFVPHGTM